MYIFLLTLRTSAGDRLWVTLWRRFQGFCFVFFSFPSTVQPINAGGMSLISQRVSVPSTLRQILETCQYSVVSDLKSGSRRCWGSLQVERQRDNMVGRGTGEAGELLAARSVLWNCSCICEADLSSEHWAQEVPLWNTEEKYHSLEVGLAYIQRKHPMHRYCFPSSDLKELDGWDGSCR